MHDYYLLMAALHAALLAWNGYNAGRGLSLARSCDGTRGDWVATWVSLAFAGATGGVFVWACYRLATT